MASPAAVLNILVTANTTQANAALARTDAQLKKTAATANTTMAGPTGMGSKLATAGKVGGAAIATLGVVSVKAAAQFQTAFAEVRKTVDANEKGFKRIETGLRDLSTRIPVTATELANLAGQAGALGIKSRDIVKFTKTAAELGIATDMSADQAANALARLSNIMKTSSDDFRRLGSTMVELGNKGASTEAEISEMALRIAGAGKTIGLTEAQVLGLSSALANVGIRAEMGGSAISRVMLQMQDAIAKGGGEMERFAQISGVTTQQFAKQFAKDAPRAIAMFAAGLDKVVKSGASVMTTLDGVNLNEIRVRDTLLRVANNTEQFVQAQQIANDEWKRNSALTEEANRRYETFDSKVQVLKNNVQDLGITIGNELLPPLTKVTDVLNMTLRGESAAGQIFGNMNPLTQELADKFVEVARGSEEAVDWIKRFGMETPQAAEAVMKMARRMLQAGTITRQDFRNTTEEINQFAKESRQAAARVIQAQKEQAQGFTNMNNQARHALHDTAETGKRESGRLRSGVVGNVQAMADGVRGGLQNVVNNTNKALKGFGVDKQTYVAFEAERANLPQSRQRGGVIVPGQGSGDKVPAMLEPGEVVLNRNAVAAMGGAGAANKINRLIPRFAKGGVASALNFALGPYDIPPIQYDPNHAGGNSHLHLSMNSVAAAKSLAARMRPMGWTASESPWAGGVTVAHQDPGHYTGAAFDANTAADETRAEVAAVARLLKGAGGIGAVAAHVARTLLKGPNGPLREMGQNALDRATQAANKFLGRQGPNVGETGFNSSYSGPLDRVFPHPTSLASPGIQLSSRQIGQVMRGARLPSVFKGIAMDESGWHPGIVGYDSGGTRGLGLWQITTGFNDDIIRRFGGETQMFNPVTNALAAKAIFDRQPNAWAASGNAMQRGGIVQKFGKGGTVGPGGAGGRGSSGPGAIFGGAGGGGGAPDAHVPDVFKKVAEIAQAAIDLEDHVAVLTAMYGWASSASGNALSPDERTSLIGANEFLLGVYNAYVEKLQRAIPMSQRGSQLRTDLEAALTGVKGPPIADSKIFGVIETLDDLRNPDVGVTGPSIDEQIATLRVPLLEQLLSDANAVTLQYASQAAALSRFAGPFHGGGVVPGPVGATVPAVVRSGEGIFTPEQMAAMGGSEIRVVVEDGAVDPNKIRVEVRNELTREIRTANRNPIVVGARTGR